MAPLLRWEAISRPLVREEKHFVVPNKLTPTGQLAEAHVIESLRESIAGLQFAAIEFGASRRDRHSAGSPRKAEIRPQRKNNCHAIELRFNSESLTCGG